MSKRLTKTIWYGSGVDSNGNPILPSNNGGLDGLNYGELYLHLSNGKATLWTLSSEGKIVEITGGGSDVDMSSYLLKSIWDKVFEIRTDSQGREYIFGKLPMVTQYGITMYSGDGVDVPSLASGLPFDGRTIWYNPDTQQIEVIGGTGGGSGEGVSNFWDLNGIPSWITITKPKYTYSEIEGTPDLTKYALVSQIPSLSGYATESWVAKQNYATKATTLSGYGITDAYTKTNVDDLLKAYVTLGGTQTITGEKNFTGGLKVNGSPIYYDTDKKYWKLEGDLLVTGGVTMYGNDSSFTPSTIMDAIAVDGTTISKSGGVLKVVGGTGGGVADSVAWANITGKPTWIGSSKPSYSYSEITGAISTTELQNYLTQNSYLNVTSGDNRYLKLSGGTLSSNLTVQNKTVDVLTLFRSDVNTSPSIKFVNSSDGTLGYIGVMGSTVGLGHEPFFMDKSANINKIWHSGNFNPSNYLPLSGGTITNTLQIGSNDNTSFLGLRIVRSGSALMLNPTSSNAYIGLGSFTNGTYSNKYMLLFGETGLKYSEDGQTTFKDILHSGNYSNYALPLSGGMLKGSGADFFQVNRTDGNPVISYYYNGSWLGRMGYNTKGSPVAQIGGDYQFLLHSGNIGSYNAGSATKLQTARTIWGQSFDGTGNVTGQLNITTGTNVSLTYGTGFLTIGNMASGHITIDTNDIQAKANGTTTATLYLNDYGGNVSMCGNSGNVGIGTTNPAYKLDVNGTVAFGSAATFYDVISINRNGSSGAILNTSKSALKVECYNTYTSFNTYTGGGASNANVFVLRDNGNVGIGITNPSVKLHVSGDILATSSIRTNSHLTADGQIYVAGSVFYGNGSEGIYIHGTGINFHNSSNVWKASCVTFDGNGNMTALHNLLVNGGITMYSQRSLKNIVDERGLSLSELSKIKPTRYTWKDGRDNRLHFGGIADDIQQVLPEVVYKTSEGILTMDYGNAAFAVASSLIQPIVDHEKRIVMLEEENKQLRKEVERLKSA